MIRLPTMWVARAIIVLPLLLAACGDPYDFPGSWHPVGLNDANLAVMAKNKQDLVEGHERPGSDGTLDAAAVQRLHEDKARHLPVEVTSSLSGGS